jgi:hypothetical protein
MRKNIAVAIATVVVVALAIVFQATATAPHGVKAEHPAIQAAHDGDERRDGERRDKEGGGKADDGEHVPKPGEAK